MAANFGSDPWLDARLRNVPLPVGMLARLNEVASLEDEQLDAAIRDVPLPADLSERLAEITLMPRWQRLLPETRVSRRQLALAASLLVAVTIGYLMLAGGHFTPSDAGTAGPPQVATSDPDAPQHVASMDSVAEPANDDQLVSSRDDMPEDLAADDDEPLFPPIEFKPLPLPRGPAHRPRNPLFASDVATDRQPQLETISAAADRGLAPPLVPGYDLLEHIKTGERSFAAPSANPQLAASLIPLRHDSSTYRLAQRYLSQGRLPAAEDVRIEDFIGAQCDHYPPAESKLVLRIEAGPAPFGEQGLRLLQVGVQAGRLATPRPATDLTIAVDTSASMRHGRRLEMVRGALRQLAGQLQPTDRVTLIAFSDDAELLIENLRLGNSAVDVATGAAGATVSDEAVEQLLAAVDNLHPVDGTNVGAAIELAAGTILRSAAEPARRRQLVLVSDGLGQLSGQASSQIGALLRSLTTSGVRFDAIDVSGDRSSSGRLAELAEVGAGRCVAAADRYEMALALSDSLAGGAQTVAHSAMLRVAFNPQAVGAYRLVGHATTTITGPAAASTQVDLHAGASAAGLFELWLLPGGGDEVATVELAWREPGAAETQKLTQRVSRLQFAKSFAEAPLPLQASAIAAEAARGLRNHSAGGARHLTRVLELAGQAHQQLQDSDSFRELVALVGRAEKIRASGTPSRHTSASAKP